MNPRKGIRTINLLLTVIRYNIEYHYKVTKSFHVIKIELCIHIVQTKILRKSIAPILLKAKFGCRIF